MRRAVIQSYNAPYSVPLETHEPVLLHQSVHPKNIHAQNYFSLNQIQLILIIFQGTK